MMMQLLNRLNLRQQVLCVMILVAIVVAFLLDAYIFPAYTEMKTVRELVAAKAAKYAELKANLEAGERIDQQYKATRHKIEQHDKDEIVLSAFLSELEEMSRHPSMRIVNMRPNPVKDEGACKVYRVRMAVSGKIQKMLEFFSSVTGDGATALESFVLRGVQGMSMVECSFSVCRIRVLSDNSKVRTAKNRKPAKRKGV